jgi:hypothetical protein
MSSGSDGLPKTTSFEKFPFRRKTDLVAERICFPAEWRGFLFAILELPYARRANGIAETAVSTGQTLESLARIRQIVRGQDRSFFDQVRLVERLQIGQYFGVTPRL